MSLGLKILAVDDEELNLDIMQEYFDDARYKASQAHDGLEALKALEQDNHYDVIVLDRMMPNMDGMQFLEKVKSDSRFRDIPVIMQTAASSSNQVTEGIKAGVFYYLSKPYTKDVFLSIIRAANDDAKRKQELRNQLKEYGHAMSMIQNGDFQFRTVEDAKALAILLGSSVPDPEMVIVGLTELMVNGVEHGNLGITYDEKKALKLKGAWESEILRRQKLPENSNKYCTASVKRCSDQFKIKIQDQGSGFDWKKYQVIDVARLADPNGRGIAMTMSSGFASLTYNNIGNEVECVVQLNK